MGKFTVVRYGTDTSGRAIYMTRNMKAYWEAVLDSPRVRPFAHKVTIVQGAWMSKVPGGGASASAGYHDYGGCLDVRTWNLTATELNHLIVAMRLRGAAAWRRDYQHGGFDPHIHLTLGGDGKMSYGATSQWNGYVSGGWNSDGMGGYDYEWRPSPIRHWKYKKKPKGPRINRHRVNRIMRHPGKWVLNKEDLRQLDVLNDALDRKGYSAKGWPPHEYSLRRATRKFQKSRKALKGDADGYLGRLTCKHLGIRSRWAKLPSWKRKRRLRAFKK